MKYSFKKKFKKALKDFLFATYRYKQISGIRDFIIRVNNKYINRRINSQVKTLKIIANNCNKLDLAVLNGPFKGLKYPFKEAFGSVFTPKIIGTYELELQPIIKEVLNSNYSHIIDIGAAEGYYSVGISKKLPKSKIIAFESESKGRKLHNKLVKYNNVEKKIGLNYTDNVPQYY